MNFLISIIITIISLIVLSISGGYATSAAVSTTYIEGYDKNAKLQSAHTKLSWSAVITWIVVALIIIFGIVLLLNIKTDRVNALSNIIIYLFIGLALISTAIVGILSSMAASEISGTENDQGSHTKSTIAAVLAIIGFVGITAVMIFTIIYRPKEKETPQQYQQQYQQQSQQTVDCPAANINPTILGCDKTNKKYARFNLHPDKNKGCENLANNKFTEYNNKCKF